MSGWLCDTCRNMIASYEPDGAPTYVHCRARWTVRKVKKWDECLDYEGKDDDGQQDVRQGRAR